MCVLVLAFIFTLLLIQTYTTLNVVSRDSLSVVTSQAERMIMEKTPYLLDHTRVQVKWRGASRGRWQRERKGKPSK